MAKNKRKHIVTCATYPLNNPIGTGEFTASWEDMQNDLKNGPVRIIKPPIKANNAP